jgi:predicted GNAT family acetyltransferase
MEPLQILHRIGEHRGSFVIQQDGLWHARMTYSLSGDIAIIDRTEVDPSLRGTGAGARLVEAAVEWARAEHKRIMPLCPFAKSVFDKTPAYHDVLAR